MRILLIEDDAHKSSQIISFVQSQVPDSHITLKRSYQSGLKELMMNNHDLILLDMQLPNYDINPGEDGYKFRKLAGIDILNEIKRKGKAFKIIIITQFETFGEGEFYIDLDNLKSILFKDFKGLYIDTVFYNPENTRWQKELIIPIKKVYDQNTNR